jgi:threonine dehydratase
MYKKLDLNMNYTSALMHTINAQARISPYITQTPTELNKRLSTSTGNSIYLKREDMQPVRSYKLRGALNAILQADATYLKCVSAGNHAQGFAFAVNASHKKGLVVMPITTPKQKCAAVKRFGCDSIDIVLHGDTFDEAARYAQTIATDAELIHPFDNDQVMFGQATIGLELAEFASNQLATHNKQFDYIFVPVGGGGLSGGLTKIFSQLNPRTKLIYVEPAGAASLYESVKQQKRVKLDKIDTFIDGAAVAQIGERNYEVLKSVSLDSIISVQEGAVCSTIMELYSQDGIIAEPAGALSVVGMQQYFAKHKITHATACCIVSGGNNDFDRLPEIKMRARIYEGLRHYFLVQFSQRPGSLKEFLLEVLGPNDDIIRFEYMKKSNKDKAPAIVGIELAQRTNYEPLLERLQHRGVQYTEILKNPTLIDLLL